MLYRPRFHAAIVVLLAVSSTSCALEVDLRDSNFSCSAADDRCPTGMSCIDDYCVLPGGGAIDAGTDPEQRDADPLDPVIDAAPEPEEIDAAGAVDAAEPAVCIGNDVISDPATGHCYSLVREGQTWDAARLACQLLDMQLAVITSAAEQAVAEQIVAGSSVAQAWIGASDQASEGSFVWVDGSDVVYDNWNDGEPNDYGNGEDCAAIRFSLGGKWDDRGCDGSLFVLCEKEP